MVIWVLGLSGAGKTTLCQAIFQLLKPQMPGMVVLDGDVVRQAFGQDLGHNEADRIRQFQRLQGMAKVLADQKFSVIVAAVYSNKALLDWNRKNLKGYFEVYVDASLETVKRRDSKGLYKAAEEEKIRDVVGIDIPFRAPSNPDVVVNANDQDTAQALASTLLKSLPNFSSVPETNSDSPSVISRS